MKPSNPIREIMTKNLVTVFANDHFNKVREIFDTYDFHHIPVINLDGSIAGIISKEDWLRKLRNIASRTTGKTWTEMQYKSFLASDIMTSNPMELDPDDTIGLAADIFLANKFHALPIVEDGKLLGIITSHDLLRYAFSKVLEYDNS